MSARPNRQPPPFYDLARHWSLDPAIAFLNHGSFGACPVKVLEYQGQLRERMERQPVQFFVRDMEGLLDLARSKLAAFVGAEPKSIAFVPNATAGVNAVLRSLKFRHGDELLTTNHEYNACRNALEFAAQRAGAKVTVATIPFPLSSSDQAVEAVLAKVSDRTRLALLDHVSSQTALVLPIERLVKELSQRGVDTLVDGAHAPGMVPLDLASLGAAYYTGNCHKWLCAPKGSAFLFVRPDRQEDMHPISISHGFNSQRKERSRFWIEFDWTGTFDPTAYLSVPEALRFMDSLVPGGWNEIMKANRSKALAGRAALCRALGIPSPCPDEMIGSIASVPLPDGSAEPPKSALYADPLQDVLLGQYGVEVPVVPWPAPPKRLLRISAQLYNSAGQYEYLAEALKEVLERNREEEKK